MDELIDRFVHKINHSPRHRIREEDVPVSLREGGARAGLYYNWTIQRFVHITWIGPLESEIQRLLPLAYRSLVTRYIFPAFEAGPVLLLANTGQDLYHEMSMTMTRDRVVSPLLLKAGYAQFGRAAGGGYDPICFDFTRCESGSECPLVRIDHEQLLSQNKPVVTQQIASSFRSFVEEFLQVDEILQK